MKTVVYRIERVVENKRTYFQLVRDEDYAIISAKENIEDLLDEYLYLQENRPKGKCYNLSEIVTTKDYTVRKYDFYLNK